MISAEAIAKTPFFRGLPREQLELLAEIAIPRSYRRGEMIFTEGEEGKGFYLVLGGQVEIFKLSPEGKKQILHILGKGEPFGEVTVFAGVPFPAHAKALGVFEGDTVTWLWFDKDKEAFTKQAIKLKLPSPSFYELQH